MDADDYLPISALQHLLFCERQCALIHIEQAWSENVFTAEGRALHDKADTPGVENRPGVRVARALRITSERLRISGIADIIEFHKTETGEIPYPVEYKRGKRGDRPYDAVQLCAQAMALEEMLGAPVPEGAIYYHQTRRRKVIALDDELRAATENAAKRLHELIRSGVTPLPRQGEWCESCSLLEICMPGAIGKTTVKNYLDGITRG